MKSPELLSNPAALDRGNELLSLIVNSYNRYRQSGLAPDAIPDLSQARSVTTHPRKSSVTEAENQILEQQLVTAMTSSRPNNWNLSYKEVLEFLHDNKDRALVAEALPGEYPFSHYRGIESLGEATYTTRIVQGHVAIKFAYLSFLTVNETPGAKLPKYGINTFDDLEGDGRMETIVKLAIE